MPNGPHSPSTADVIVIGGGVIGCSIALRLAQARMRVMVVERGEPGGEASSAAAGMLAPQGEAIELDPFFELCAASRDAYPQFVAEIEELSGEEVGYRGDGTLLVGIEEKECRELDEIYAAQSRYGLPIERLDAAAVARRVTGLSPAIAAGIFIPGDHWVDNERLALGLVKACQKLGVIIHSGTSVTRLNVRDGRVESLHAASSATGSNSDFTAGQFVLAAGCWSGELMAPLGVTLPIVPCRGQMMEFDALEELPLVVRAGHHYMVPRPGRRVLVGTTAEYVGFDKAVTGQGLRSILDGAARIAPLMGRQKFRRAWAGLRPDTPDHLPIQGYGDIKNLVLATGHFRNGILLAPLTAQLITELILGRPVSHPMDTYNPMRFKK